ncbi:discoidin domain-containing protein [Lysinibacillus fusiformis]|uniref:discoidin domain-containing protein n=1 Tax=Lysinibacillus fusiformis TaxID=28031 RepID=UPI0011AADE9F|nr:discoidin domain-containing protein [Lysinibacillus fusiformis]
MPSIKINEQVLSFNNIYYVDSIIGSDTNNGSKSSPFATVNYAVSKCATTGDAIFALAGTHDVTRIAGTNDSGGLWDDNKAIAFIGEKGKTTFLCDGRKHSGRDTHCIMFKNEGTRAYQIIFDFHTGNSRTLNYETSICYAGASVKGEVHNCVIRYNTNVSPSLMYGNSTSATIKFVNCVFDVQKNFTSSYSGIGSTTLENCVTNFAFYAEGTRINVYNQCTFDSKYQITNYDEIIQGIGVYSGLYGWLVNKFLFQSKLKGYSFEEVGDAFNFVLTSNSSPAPFFANSSSVYSTPYPAWKAFDKDIATSWLSSGATNQWISFNFGKPLNIDFISIQGVSSAITSAYVITANPKNLRIQGSNDNLNWDTLYYATNLSWTKEEIKTFSLSGNIKYQNIRIFIESNNGGPYIGISDITFGFNGLRSYILPSCSMRNMLDYGMSNTPQLNTMLRENNYVLQKDNSGNKEKIRIKDLEKKPISISFN